jgi:comEA protein
VSDLEEEQSQQIRCLVVLAAVLCALLIGYNAFYVPDAPLSEPQVTADVSSQSEAYVPHSARAGSSKSASSTKSGGKVNINTASVSQLSQKLPGIGDGIARRIVSYREQHGLFRSVEDIRKVPGIGDKKYEKIKGLIAIK